MKKTDLWLALAPFAAFVYYSHQPASLDTTHHMVAFGIITILLMLVGRLNE